MSLVLQHDLTAHCHIDCDNTASQIEWATWLQGQRVVD
jgi:hypothetical protein